jgi:hypothetical protein
MDHEGGQNLNYLVMQPEQPQINVQQLGNQLSALTLDQKAELVTVRSRCRGRSEYQGLDLTQLETQARSASFQMQA